MSQLDPRIETIRLKYELQKDDFWKLPQGRDVWLVKHSAIEVIAVKAGITFDMPEIVQANAAEKTAVIVARGFMGERSEWSFGEATPYNNKNTYPFAMAEKRAKDRVVLKLVGLHGLAYSEDESDDFKEPPVKSSAQLKREDVFPKIRDELANEMLDVHTFGQFEEIKGAYRQRARVEGWNTTFLAQLGELFEGHAEELQKRIDDQNAAPADLSNNPYAKAFAGG